MNVGGGGQGREAVCHKTEHGDNKYFFFVPGLMLPSTKTRCYCLVNLPPGHLSQLSKFQDP